MVGQGDPQGIVKEIDFWPFKQTVYAQLRIFSEEWNTETPLGLLLINGTPNLGQTTRLYNNQQKRENLLNYGLCYPGWPLSTIERNWKEG